MDASLWVALIGGVALIVSGVLSWNATIRNAILTGKSQRDSANATADADKYESLIKAQENMREEYRTDARRLDAQLHEAEERHARELRELNTRVAELDARVIHQTKYMESVAMQMEAALKVQDSKMQVMFFERILREMQEFMQRFPVIGLPEIAKNRVIEAESE